jgi:hypothetical protein
LTKQAPVDIFCNICLQIVDLLTRLIINGRIEPAFEEVVTESYDLFPWPVTCFCQDLIDQFIHEISADIEADIGDIYICSLIGLSATPVSPERAAWVRIHQLRGRHPRVETMKKDISH